MVEMRHGRAPPTSVDENDRSHSACPLFFSNKPSLPRARVPYLACTKPIPPCRRGGGGGRLSLADGSWMASTSAVALLRKERRVAVRCSCVSVPLPSPQRRRLGRRWLLFLCILRRALKGLWSMFARTLPEPSKFWNSRDMYDFARNYLLRHLMIIEWISETGRISSSPIRACCRRWRGSCWAWLAGGEGVHKAKQGRDPGFAKFLRRGFGLEE